METVYIETTVIGNIAGRLHPNSSIADRQTITRKWWATASSRYRLVTSQITLDECGDGDTVAASERLHVVSGIELLDVNDAARALTKSLLKGLAVPASQPRDALLYRHCRRSRYRIHRNLEFQAYPQSAFANADCGHLSKPRLRTTRTLHT